MGTYGRYETVSRIGHSPQAEVWTARAAGAEADELEQLVVKVYHPIESGLEEEPKSVFQEVLDASRVQQEMARAHPEHWAPIREVGEAGNEAFYVTDYYNHSAEDLTRVNLKSGALHVILAAVVQGLSELKQTANRPHGNLKTTNVLIRTGADITKAQVFLADPLPGTRLKADPRAAAVADLRGLGRLLHRLAVQREPVSRGTQLAPSAEGWDRLGRKGKAWHDLCTRLLMTPEALSLEQVGEELEKFHEAPASAWKRYGIPAGIAAAVAAALAVYWLTRTTPPPVVPPNADEWKELCQAQYAWFGKFSSAFREMSPQRRKQWDEGNPRKAVADALGKAQEEKVEFDPSVIAIEAGARPEKVMRTDDQLRWMEDWLSSGTWKEEGEQPKVERFNKRVGQAAAVIRAVIDALSPGQWPELAERAKWAEEWSKRGWLRPARHVSGYVDGVNLRRNPGPRLASNVEDFIDFSKKALVADAGRAWQAICECQKKLDATGDRVLATFSKWAVRDCAERFGSGEGAGTEEDVQNLLARLQAIQALGAKLLPVADDLAGKKVARDLFFKEAAVHHEFAEGKVLEHTFSGLWPTEVKDYYFLVPDPREPGKYEAEAKKIRAGYESQLKLLDREGEAAVKALNATLDKEVMPKIAALGTLVAIQKNKPDIEEKVRQAELAVRRFERQSLDKVADLAGTPKDWYEVTLKSGFRSSPAIDARWQSARKALLGNVTLTALEADRDLYLDLRRKVQKLRDGLDALDKALPAELPEEARKYSGRRWYPDFARRVPERKEDGLAKALENAGQGAVPDLENEAFAKAWEGTCKQFDAWQAQASQAVVRIAAVEDALDNCYFPDETAPGASETVGKLHQDCCELPILKSEGSFGEALKPITQRVTALDGIRAGGDRGQLAKLAADSATRREVALAAWRRLSSPPGEWPTKPDELTSETRIRERLRADLGNLPDPARSAALLKELELEGQRRDTGGLTRYLAALRQDLEKTGDAILAQFGKLVDEQLASVPQDAPKKRLDKLGELKQLAEQLAQFVARDWPKNVATGAFAKESTVHQRVANKPALALKPDTYREWIKELDEQYRYLDAADEVASKQRTAAKLSKEKIEPVIARLKDGSGQEKSLAQRVVADLEKGVAPYLNLPPIRKNRPEMEAQADSAITLLTKTERDVGVYIGIFDQMKGIAALSDAIVSKGADDKVLAAFASVVAHEKPSGTLPPEKQLERLTALRASAQKLADLLSTGDWASGKIDRALFAKEGKVYAAFDPANAPLKTYEAWLTEVEDYRTLTPDPREKPEIWDGRAKKLEADIAQLVKDGFVTQQQATDLRAKLKRLQDGEIAQILRTDPVRKNQKLLADLGVSAKNKIKDLGVEIDTVGEKPKDFIVRVQALQKVAASEAVNQQWQNRRDQLLKANTLQRLEADRQLYASVRGRFGELPAFFNGIDDGQAFPQPPAAMAAGYLAEAKKARENALTKACAAIPWDADGFPKGTLDEFKKSKEWQDAVGSLRGELALVARVEGEAALLGKLLVAGYLPGDKPDGDPKTARQVLDGWTADKVPDRLVPLAGNVVTTWKRDLIAIGGMSRKELLDLAGKMKPGGLPQAPILVWQGLGKAGDWPNSMEELKLEAALRGQAEAAAKQVAAKDPHPMRDVLPQLAKEGPRRWEVCFDALVERVDPQGAGDAELRDATAQAAPMGVKRDALSPLAQFRWLLWEFRQQMFAAPQGAKKEELLKDVAAFEQKVQALPGEVAKQREVADLLKRLRDLLERSEDTAGASGLDKGGPAAASFGITWKAAPAADGKAADYTWPDWQPRRLIGGFEAFSLTFVRVEPRGGGKAAYLCTTEMSVGLFIDVVKQAGKWQDVKDLLSADRGKGPRVWKPRLGRIGVEEEWLPADPGVQPFPPGGQPPAPAQEHPIQYVSPEAALYVARLLGCRLPTSAEWSGAFDLYEKGGVAAPRNLRDKTWQVQQKYALEQGGRPGYPDAGIFVAANADGPVGIEEKAKLVTDAADGLLWFAPVGKGPGMQYLVGNVAEFVYENSARIDQALKDPAALSAQAIRDLVAQGVGDLKVAGASALSPPEYWDGSPQRPFDRAYKVDLDRARQGFSDVGFRLAFTAPVDPPSARLVAVLKEQGYLVKPTLK